MILQLAYYGDPVLRKKVAPILEITDEIKQLAQDMRETMHAANGIGLAAPQIKKSISIFVTEVPIPIKVSEDPEKIEWKEGVFRVFINPKILEYSETVHEREEGCLSIPGVYGNVIRPVQIKVRAMDLEGNTFEEEFQGLEARAIMHENDHLNGVLFIDRIHGKERKALDSKLADVKKKFR